MRKLARFAGAQLWKQQTAQYSRLGTPRRCDDERLVETADQFGLAFGKPVERTVLQGDSGIVGDRFEAEVAEQFEGRDGLCAYI